MSEEEKKALLGIARASIRASVFGSGDTAPEPASPALREERGAFVTIYMDKRLRGCIGSFVSDRPLFRTVHEMASAAATQDPRFMPLGPGELDRISIEISVLTPLREIKDTSEIEIGRHGLYIIKGRKRGVLLPQVAVEHGFDVETFLDETCMKAGLKPGEWRTGTTIFVFEAEILKEG